MNHSNENEFESRLEELERRLDRLEQERSVAAASEPSWMRHQLRTRWASEGPGDLPHARATVAAENRQTENRPTENRPTENRQTENRLTENRLTENRLTENRLTENRLTENRLTENRATENRLTENRTARDRWSEDRSNADLSVEDASAPSDLEAQLGLTWLNRIGAAVLVVALALAASWAHKSGYLTPLVRTLLLALGSAGMLTLGLVLAQARSRATRMFSYGVVVVGALGLYVVPFSASYFDTLLSPEQAMAFSCVLTVALGALADRLGHMPLANLGALGGLSIPMLSQSQAPHFTALFVFLTAQSVGYLWVARRNRWSSVAILQAMGVTVYYLALAARPDFEAGIAQALAVTLGLGCFVALYVRDQLTGKGATPGPYRHLEHLAGSSALLGILGVWLMASVPELAAVLACGIIGMALLVVLLIRASAETRALSSLTAMALTALAGAAVAIGDTDAIILGLYGVNALAFWLHHRLAGSGVSGKGDTNGWDVLLAGAFCALPSLAIFATHENALGGGPHHWNYSLATLVALPLWLRSATTGRVLFGQALVGFVLGQIFALFALVAWISSIDALSPDAVRWLAHVAAPSVQALIILGMGVRLGRDVRVLGVALLGLVVAKALLNDVWTLSSGARVAVFLILGVVLMAASFVYSRLVRKPRAVS